MAPWPCAPVIPQLVDCKNFRDNRWDSLGRDVNGSILHDLEFGAGQMRLVRFGVLGGLEEELRHPDVLPAFRIECGRHLPALILLHLKASVVPDDDDESVQ
ncbi:hypothetical protein TNCV_4724481 [Trichonephila clavipes]|uniref:Uncharacterized protein n=1 Tax=Trichonephila clavipes TaxID=2585209 RepID=A0A8X6W734_TRICX|nr:hypothetical protein TNCV_4724481 [Trichonephila clavipes]